MQFKKQRLIIISYIIFIPQFLYSKYCRFDDQKFPSTACCSVRAGLVGMTEVKQCMNLTKINSVSNNDGIM